MNKLEDFIIDVPYPLNDDDNKAINKASPGQKDKDHWEKDCLDGFKNRFRNYMLRKQNFCCAYCRLEMHDSEASPEIDHIVPKSFKPDWMYEPFNLCLSCKLCNTIKGQKTKMLKDKEIKVLPKEKAAYRLVHPYLHRYSENIVLIDGILYSGITEEGRNTIELCGLYRYQVAAARAKIKIRHNHDIGIFTRFLLLLEDSDNERLINNVDAFIKEMRAWISVFFSQAN